jgi:hypothetical protein
MSVFTAQQIARYWQKVDRNGPVHPVLGTRCWLWIASCGGGTRQAPQVRINKRTRRAVRVGWEMVYGTPPPADLDICHHCDTPRCMNPAHWFLGTTKDNMEDAQRKGRLSVGPRHPSTKLTIEQVLALRATEHPTRLGKSFGVTSGCVSLIVNRKRWKHLS